MTISMAGGQGRNASPDEEKMTQNSDTIYVYVQTYELGKDYLLRALDSVRNQTYPNFRCLVYDNGSGSEVRRKLREYVSRDQRFSLTCFDDVKGRILTWEYGIPEILHVAGDRGGYLCLLDADDELEPDCFEKMVSRLKSDSLDLVAGGAVFINAETGEVFRERKVEEDLILEGRLFETYFPTYYQIMRTHWAKLYRLDLIGKMNLSNLSVATYGSDTLFVREALLHAKRAGVITDVLYRYYLYPEVRDYNLEERRVRAPQILFERDLSFLMLKCGDISVNTLVWLLNVYFGENEDVFRMIATSNQEDREKIDRVHKILTAIPCRFAIRAGHRTKYVFVARWLMDQDVFESVETFRQAAEIFGILGIIPIWQKGVAAADQFRMLVEIHAYWDDPEKKFLLEEQIEKYVQVSPLLQNRDAYYGRFNREIVEDVLREDYQGAYAAVLESLEQTEGFAGQFYEVNLELALNLAAMLNLEEDFVALKKKQVALFLERDVSLAHRETEEWLEILPEDRDFLEFRRQIAERKGGQ